MGNDSPSTSHAPGSLTSLPRPQLTRRAPLCDLHRRHDRRVDGPLCTLVTSIGTPFADAWSPTKTQLMTQLLENIPPRTKTIMNQQSATALTASCSGQHTNRAKRTTEQTTTFTSLSTSATPARCSDERSVEWPPGAGMGWRPENVQSFRCGHLTRRSVGSPCRSERLSPSRQPG